jgi:CBS domain-containing protein
MSPPTTHLAADLRAELARFEPFSRMDAPLVERFAAAAEQVHYLPGQTVLGPDSGAVHHLLWVRRGSVSGRRGGADDRNGFQYEAGDLFPVGAALGGRAVTATYTCDEDLYCLRVPIDAVRALAAQSPPFADFLHGRVLKFLEVSRRAVQAAYSTQVLAEQTLETPLGRLARRPPLAVGPETPLQQALSLMHERGVGSVLVLGGGGEALGILTRHDVVGRITLPQVTLDTPIAGVMSQPVHTLGVEHTAHDAVLLMSRLGLRHVPVTDGGRVVGIVSERDLHALQRLSVPSVSGAIRGALDVAALRGIAPELPRLARSLLGQGVAARQLTELISHLNDLLTARLVELIARRHPVDLERACWLAFGSEGRGEQTIATDQDNGLVFESDDPARDRPRWLAFADEVNRALDACGYPLCKGNVMARNPRCCLTPQEWVGRFEHWIDHGSPADLLNASIFFDFRPVAGRLELAAALRAHVVAAAARTPRFMKQMAENALRNRVPLNWRGAIETQEQGGRQWLDLKLNGSVLFVDAARLFALARGLGATGTRARFEAVGASLGLDARESDAWSDAFEYLQMLRLRAQIDAGAATAENPNRIDFARLNDIDRRLLKEVYRVARSLQQRMEIDYMR